MPTKVPLTKIKKEKQNERARNPPRAYSIPFARYYTTGDAAYLKGKLFGCITDITPRGVIVALDKSEQKFIQMDYAPPIRVTSIEITQELVDKGLFQIYAHDPIPELLDDEHWSSVYRIQEPPF